MENMLFLLDANVLIDANRDYYPIDRIPQYWDWLAENGNSGQIKIPIEIYEEITRGNDNLSEWIKQPDIREALLFDEEVDIIAVQKVIYEGYADDLNEIEVAKLGRDPLLISYSLKDNAIRCIVTTEVSKPSMTRDNKKIPNVCEYLGIYWCGPFEMYRRLDFRIN